MEEFQDDEKCGGGSKTMRKVEVFKTARSVEVFQDDEKCGGGSKTARRVLMAGREQELHRPLSERSEGNTRRR